MAPSFRDARTTLYGVPLAIFVDERKRLARALKAEGDKEGAARLTKEGRPSLSAWVVNQLWRHERAAFEQLFASGESLRRGAADASAARRHRTALATLRDRAAALLVAHDHAASEATLRRIHTNLAALAARGGFEAEAEGALVTDLAAPGFDAIGGDDGTIPTGGGEEPALSAPRDGAAASASPRAVSQQAPEEEASGQRGPLAIATNPAERARKQAAAEQARDEERARAQAKADAEARAKRMAAAAAERRRLDERIHAKEDEVEREGRSRERLRSDLERVESLLGRLEGELEGLRRERAALPPEGPDGTPPSG